MKIELNQTEFRALLELVEIASWVLHAHKIDEPPETEVYRKLEQKIMSQAKNFGLENLVDYDEDLKEYFPSGTFEEESPVMEFIEDFENDTFWDQMVDRLVERDMIEAEGEDAYLAMELEDRFGKEMPLREKYAEEFEANGLNNVKVG